MNLLIADAATNAQKLTRRKNIKLKFFVVLLMSFKFIHAQQLEWVSATGSKNFSSATKEFSVNKYGAKGDGTTSNTKSIQQTIDACAKVGVGS